MILEQTMMKLAKAGVSTGPPLRVLKIVLLWKEVGLAIHESQYVADKGLWAISHYESGRSVLKHIKTKEQATEYLRRLFDILEDWTFTEEEWNIQTDETKKELKEVIDKLQQEIRNGKT